MALQLRRHFPADAAGAEAAGALLVDTVERMQARNPPRSDVIWCYLIWCDLVRSGAVWCDVVRSGAI